MRHGNGKRPPHPLRTRNTQRITWIAGIMVSGLFLSVPEVDDARAQGPFFSQIEFEDVNPDFSDTKVGGSGGRVNGLASVPGNNRVFYAATEHGGLYKSTDGVRRGNILTNIFPLPHGMWRSTLLTLASSTRPPSMTAGSRA